MKTVIIYNDILNALQYAIVDGDYSRFNDVAFNSINEHPFENECNDFLFGDEGVMKLELSSDVSLLQNKQWDKVACITFLP